MLITYLTFCGDDMICISDWAYNRPLIFCHHNHTSTIAHCIYKDHFVNKPSTVHVNQDVALPCQIMFYIPYVANHLRWKSFAVAELNCNSLVNICSWTVVLHGQSLLHRLYHWKSFVVTAKTVKLFHLERFAIYFINMKPFKCWKHKQKGCCKQPRYGFTKILETVFVLTNYRQLPLYISLTFLTVDKYVW